MHVAQVKNDVKLRTKILCAGEFYTYTHTRTRYLDLLLILSSVLSNRSFRALLGSSEHYFFGCILKNQFNRVVRTREW